MSNDEIIMNMNYYILNNVTSSDESTLDIYNRWICDNKIVISDSGLLPIILEQIDKLKHFDKELLRELL